MTPTRKQELLPCPFCGGEAAHNKVTYSERTAKENGWEQETFFGINCIICGANNKGLVGFDTPEKAAKKWNTRSNEDGSAVEPTEARSDDNAELIADLKEYKSISGFTGFATELLERAIAALSAPTPVRSDEPVAWKFSRITSQGRFSDLSFDEPKKSSEIDYIEPLCLCSPAPSHVAHDGMVSVPIEPTEEMIKAGREVFGGNVEDTDADYKRIYKAMIAIAGKEET